MRTAATYCILIVLAVSGIGTRVKGQSCQSIPWSNDQIGIQSLSGLPGDTVWAPVWVITDSTLLAFILTIRFDTTILAPIALNDGSGRLVVEAAGRFAGSEFLWAQRSAEPEDSGALRVAFLPQGPADDTIPAGSGVILRIPLVVQPAAWSLSYPTLLTFPRRTFYVVDSTSNRPDSTAHCQGTQFMERSDGVTGTNEGFPRPDVSRFHPDECRGSEPLITDLQFYPRSVRQGDSISVFWNTCSTDSIVITPGIGMHPSTSHAGKFAMVYDTPTVFTFAAFGGGTSVSREVRLLAVPPGANRYPYWQDGPIVSARVWEGNPLQGTLPFVDPEGTTPTVSVTPTSASATVGTPPSSSVYFSWQPEVGDTGVHDFVLVLTDGEDSTLTDTLLLRVDVLDANQLPTWTLDTTTATIAEADTLTVPISTADQDGTVTTVEAHLYGRDTLATNMRYIDHGDGTGALLFAPDYTQGNTHPTWYVVSFTIRDGADPAVVRESNRKTIKVLNHNSGTEVPAIALSNGPGPFALYELDTVVFEVRATTQIGDRPELSTTPLPPGATFEPVPGTTLSDRMTFRYRPPEGSVGDYSVTFTATNGDLHRQVTVDFSVAKLNRSPWVVVLPGDNTINEEDTAIVKIYAIDPDSTVPILSAALDGTDSLARNMRFVDSGNGIGVLTFVPNRLQSGDCGDPGFYYLRFRAADRFPPYPVAVSIVRTIIVYDSGLPCCVDRTGDVNYDGNGYGTPNISDLVDLVRYFTSESRTLPCYAEADLDGSGTFTIADVVVMVGHLYRGTGPLLSCPVQPEEVRLPPEKTSAPLSP